MLLFYCYIPLPRVLAHPSTLKRLSSLASSSAFEGACLVGNAFPLLSMDENYNKREPLSMVILLYSSCRQSSMPCPSHKWSSLLVTAMMTAVEATTVVAVMLVSDAAETLTAAQSATDDRPDGNNGRFCGNCHAVKLKALQILNQRHWYSGVRGNNSPWCGLLFDSLTFATRHVEAKHMTHPYCCRVNTRKRHST